MFESENTNTTISELFEYIFRDSDSQDEVLRLIQSSIDVSYWLYETNKPIGTWPGAEPIKFIRDDWYCSEPKYIPYQEPSPHSSKFCELDLSQDFPWKILEFFDTMLDEDGSVEYQFIYLLDNEGNVVINFNDYWTWKKMESKRAERCINMSPEGYDKELPF